MGTDALEESKNEENEIIWKLPFESDSLTTMQENGAFSSIWRELLRNACGVQQVLVALLALAAWHATDSFLVFEPAKLRKMSLHPSDSQGV